MATTYAHHGNPHTAADPRADALAHLREAITDVELIARRFEDTASHSAGTLYGAVDAIRAARDLIAAEPACACGHGRYDHSYSYSNPEGRACGACDLCACGRFADAADAPAGSGERGGVMVERCASSGCPRTTAGDGMMDRLLEPAGHEWAGRVLCAWHMGRLARRIRKADPTAAIVVRDVRRNPDGRGSPSAADPYGRDAADRAAGGRG